MRDYYGMIGEETFWDQHRTGEDKMKKIITSLLTIMLGLLMSVNVMADVQEGKQSPDYKTDYYMIVESKAGGIDIYSLPDMNSTKLNDGQIPNGTALHIEGETEDKENNRTWGYTEYHGMYGYVPLDDCRPAQSRKEAIDSELYIAGRDNVDYNADYNVRAYTEDGTQKLYQGPGSKYGEVQGVREIGALQRSMAQRAGWIWRRPKNGRRNTVLMRTHRPQRQWT